MCHSPLLIAFGANIDPLNNLQRGLLQLHQALGVAAVSTVYRTIPVGNSHQPPFLNGAVRTRRGLPPRELKTLLRRIESHQRRTRDPADPNAPRTLDLDIALMGERVVNTREITIPDPEIPHRPFLALPLAELAPGLRHPIEGVTLAELAGRFGPHPAGMVSDADATAALRAIVQQPPGPPPPA